MLRRLTLLAVLALALAGCGSDDDAATTQPEPATTTAETTGPALKVGLVTDIGGLDDRSFNFLANRGLERAEEELGVEGRVLISKADRDYIPNLTTLAKQDYDLVIAVGFLMAEAVAKVAVRYPDVDFAIIDFSQAELKGTPANVRGLLFKEQEAGYLVGYLAGLLTKEEAGSRQVIGSVGGLKIPPVDRYIAGYQAGAKAANPEIETLNGYSQDFVDQAKCKEAALDQIGRGARVIFQVAGQCGLGALSAAGEKNVRGIGVDADQGYLGAHILTSALKKVDVSVFETVKAVQDGSFKGGADQIFDVKNDGVGYGKLNTEGQKYQEQLDQVLEQIKSGEITDIPTEVK